MISQVTALPLWNYSVCTNKASNRVFFFFFFLPFYQKKKEIRGLWMLGTCLFLKFYMCHLISVLCHFCKEKTPFYLFFCLIFCGCFMHFIFVGLPALFLTVNKREPFTCFCFDLTGELLGSGNNFYRILLLKNVTCHQYWLTKNLLYRPGFCKKHRQAFFNQRKRKGF